MKLILLSFLVTMSVSQTQEPTPTPTQTLTLSPTTTPMGSPMFTYSLSFPNSDPATAVRSDNLEYLIKAIACSSNSPIELVYISYVRANGNVVSFTQKRHITTGLIKDCSAPALLTTPPSLRGLQVAATTNMLVGIYYLAPHAANPADPLFQPYASVISSAAVAAAALLGNSSGSSAAAAAAAASASGQSTSLSTGGIVGIVLGIVAATLLAAAAYALYTNRRQPQSTKTHPTSSPKLAWMSSPISVR